MPEQIQLQQALFGYRDGHNLLATSTALAPRVRQFLATITDSSGPESIKGFEGAVTGLPVPETDFYAIFRTWPALEMPRPGCVWSHLILIQLADLARIPDLSRLPHLCARPPLSGAATRYETTLAFNIATTEPDRGGMSDETRIHYLIEALYENSERGVVVLDEDSASWEDPIFTVWTQQWPRLRREFAFSTGSLGDRRLAGVPFDLQIAPVSGERLWRRTDNPTLLLNYQSQRSIPFGHSIPEWIGVSKEDIRRSSDRRFRQFLFDYGSDIDKPRNAFAKLAATYNLIAAASPSAWYELLCSVGEAFPDQNEAVRLKRWLVTLPSSLSSAGSLDRALGIVSFLLDSPGSAAYPKSSVDVSSAAVSLWKGKRDQTIALLSRLVQREERALVVSFVEGIANAVDSSSLKAIVAGHAELVPLVIKYNPALAFEIDTWNLSVHVQTQVYDTLKLLQLSQADWGKIVSAMFIASSHVCVRDAVAMAGHFAMPGAFEWLEHRIAHEVLPSPAWRDALSSAAIAILTQTTNLGPAQLALSAWCAPASDVRQILSSSREDVQQLADVSPEAIPLPLRTSTAFLLLAIGLKENSVAAAKLILGNFFTVHEALAAGAYSSDSWWLISPELPALGWWRDWDRCKKLRRAVHRFLAHYEGGLRLSDYAKTPNDLRIARKVTGIDSDESSSEFVD